MVRKKLHKDKLIFNILGYIAIITFSILCIIPFWIIIAGSLTSEDYINKNGFSMIIGEFSLDGYKYMFNAINDILMSYGVTTLVTVIGTAVGVFITAMTGYALSRKDFKYRNKFSFFFFFTTLFSGGLIPWYILCSQYLHFKDNILALILPNLIVVWNILLMKGFMSGIPDSLSEAAHIDGAGDFTIFMKIILPLSKPAIATISLFTALTYWNDWYNSMLFISDSKLSMLQFYLYKLINSAQGLQMAADKAGVVVASPPIESSKMAMTLVVTGPIVLLYPFVQRYFVKGMTLGAVKG